MDGPRSRWAERPIDPAGERCGDQWIISVPRRMKVCPQGCTRHHVTVRSLLRHHHRDRIPDTDPQGRRRRRRPGL